MRGSCGAGYDSFRVYYFTSFIGLKSITCLSSWAGPYVEFNIEPTPWTDGLYQPALKVQDGKSTIPDEPGWGVKINPNWLAKAERQVTKLG